MLRSIFGLKRDEVTGGLRKLHNEIKVDEMSVAYSTKGGEGGCL
jgi:hypothetical protein